MIPASYANVSFIAVVPIDDENCLRFHVHRTGGRGNPVNEIMHEGVTTGYHSDPKHNTSDWLGRFKLAGNRRNDYLIDRETQRANKGGLGYSGIPGRGQDGAVTESMGVIYQRDNEHLGVTDTGIIRMRRLLANAAKALRDHGTVPPGVDRPELYRMRSTCTVLPNGVEGISAARDYMYQPVLEAKPEALATTTA
jgi:hypothetical protein